MTTPSMKMWLTFSYFMALFVGYFFFVLKGQETETHSKRLMILDANKMNQN